MKYHANPVDVLAEQVSDRAWGDMDGEAERLRRVLGVADGMRLYGGGLLGHIIVEEGQEARPTDWLAVLPDLGLHVFHDPLFKFMFAPSDEVAVHEGPEE